MVVAFLRPRMTSGQTSGAAAQYREREILRFKHEFDNFVHLSSEFAAVSASPIDIFVYYLPLEHY